jgi:uncharacterized YigZ family protein
VSGPAEDPPDASMTHEIGTVASTASVELERIRGSRFIGDVAPAHDEAAAAAFVADVRAREPAATHHCWAYRLADGRARSSDDGEPGGTAGPPILQRIEGGGLHDVVVVVTRYHGGTNLGRGGLVRAYGEAAAAALAAAGTRTRPVVASFSLRYPYGASGAVDAAVAAHRGHVLTADYGAEVEVTVAVPLAAAGAFARAVVDGTAGTVRPQRLT